MKISNRKYKALTQLDLFTPAQPLDLDNAKKSLKEYNAKLRATKRKRAMNRFTHSDSLLKTLPNEKPHH